ncbi:MAG: radical SAM protein [Bacteroidales bacterium]|nr:radical SAM protein [Bacteroidales bacterium]MDD3858986.1 radical SAM protein [Bacteroidales bacterium]
MSKKQQISIPHIALEVNNSCNQKCIFCYNHIPHNNKNKGSNYIKLKKVLKQVYSHANVDSITFTGGEPLIEERLPELVLFAKMKNSLTTIISNGTLFSDQIINNLVLIKNDLFQLPIHSFSAEIHDKMTGLTGSHEKSVIALQKLKAKKANVVAVIVLTSQNAETISKTIDFIINLGIKQISVDRYNIGGVNKKTADKILPDINLLKKTYLLINSKAKDLKLNITSNVCTPHCVINPAEYPFIRFGNCPENPLHFPLTLDISGNVRVCNHSPIITGNIFKQDFPDILNTPYVKSWNTNIPEYCKNCKLWSICRGGCRAASEQNGMNNKSVDPIVSILKNY